MSNTVLETILETKVIAVGGVTPQNTPDFLAAGCVGVGVGGNLASWKLVAEGRLEEITKTAQAYVKAVRR